MIDIKPIETIYNGYRFRSRLEARWAVFFDEAGIEYEYEPEGFVSPSGFTYLPDFYLPDFDLYAEVKADRPEAEKDVARCRDHIYWGGPIKAIVFLSAIPSARELKQLPMFPILYWSFEGIEYDWFSFNCESFDDDDPVGGCLHRVFGFEKPKLFKYTNKSEFSIAPTFSGKIRSFRAYQGGEILEYHGRVIRSFDKARQARFEHGEKP